MAKKPNPPAAGKLRSSKPVPRESTGSAKPKAPPAERPMVYSPRGRYKKKGKG